MFIFSTLVSKPSTKRGYHTPFLAGYLQSPENVLDDLVGLGLATEVRAEELALLKVGIDGGVDLGSSLLLVQELQHERSAAKSGNGVGNVLAHDVRGTTVAGLTNGEALTNVGAGHETERTDKGSSTVGENVTVQVGSNNDVVGLGLAEELVDHAVNDLLLDLDLAGKLLGGEGLAGSGTEKAVGLGEDVALVGDGDERRLVDAGDTSLPDLLASQSDLTSHGGDPGAGLVGDALDSLGDLSVGTIVGLLLLDVQVLGVFTDDDHVNGVLCGHDSLDGADVGVEVQSLAEGNDGRAVALDGRRGRGDGTEESAIALGLEDFDGLVREGGAGLLEGLETSLEVGELELEAEGRGQSLENAATGRNDLTANTVTGDKTYGRGSVGGH